MASITAMAVSVPFEDGVVDDADNCDGVDDGFDNGDDGINAY